MEAERIVIAEGGKGGRGNRSFRSSTQQAPRIATPGIPGEEKELQLELKSLCDVGFVGFPNAGKSSLLAALTAARPKVSDYPFTTLNPQLGVLESQGLRFQLADIPGLIEGAHQNRGLGQRFLRHISRAKLLVFLLSPDQDVSLLQSLESLRAELQAYDPELLNKGQLVVVNKSDLLETEPTALEEWAQLKEVEPQALLISALHQTGLEPLITDLAAMLLRANSEDLCYSEAK